MSKNNNKRKGLWIPKDLLINPELDCANKMLLSEIHSLHKLVKGCIAPNEFFSNLLGMTKSAASKRVTRLKKLGYIHTENKYVEGVCTGRKITPTFKKYSTGNVPKLIEGSSPKKQELVPEQLDGSSQTTMGVVPEIPDGSSHTNTINTANNSKEIIHNINTGAGDNSELSLSDSSQFENKISIHEARAAYNEWFDDYPNWESDLLRLGADGFIKIATKYHHNDPVSLEAIRWYATL